MWSCYSSYLIPLQKGHLGMFPRSENFKTYFIKKEVKKSRIR